MPVGAVITGDIVASTKLEKPTLRRLMKDMAALLAPHSYEFYRGDSFQVYIKDRLLAFPVILQLRTAALKVVPDSAVPVSDVRASIGIGNVKFPVRLLRTTTDEAFVLSGRAFDALRASQRLAIAIPGEFETAQEGLQVVSEFADYLLQRMTVKQAAVVSELLLNRTQKEAAKRLKRSQATIHKHAQAAGWPQLENLLLNFEMLTKTLTV